MHDTLNRARTLLARRRSIAATPPGAGCATLPARRATRLALLAGALVAANAAADTSAGGAAASVDLDFQYLDHGGVSVSLGGSAAPELLWQTRDESIFACAATTAPCEPQQIDQAADWSTDMGFEIPLGADPLAPSVYALADASHADGIDPSSRHLVTTLTFIHIGQHRIAIAQGERRGTFTVNGSGIVAFAAPVDSWLLTAGNTPSTYAYASITAALRLTHLDSGRTAEDRFAASSDDPARDDEWGSLDTGVVDHRFLIAALHFEDGDMGEVSFFSHAVAETAPLAASAAVPLPPSLALLGVPALLLARRSRSARGRDTTAGP